LRRRWHERESRSRRQYGNQNSCNRPLIKKPDKQSLTERDQRDGPESRTPRSTHADTTIAWCTIVIAVLTFGGLLVNKKQWDTAADQLNFAENSAASSAKQTQDALNIAEIAANAAVTQANATQQLVGTGNKQIAQGARQFAIQQQPWIDLDQGRKVGDFGFDGRVFGWNFFYKNVGQSAARDLRIVASLSVLGKPARVERRPGPTFMAKDGYGDSSITVVPSPNDIQEWRSGKPQNPILDVTFWYEDQFGEHHSSGFCQYRLDGDPSVYTCKHHDRR